MSDIEEFEIQRDSRGRIVSPAQDLLDLSFKIRKICDFMSLKRKKRIIRKERVAEKQFLKQWQLENEAKFNKDKILKNWDKLSEDMGRKLLDTTIHSLAMSSGAQKANETLYYGLDMREVTIDENDISKLSSKLYQLEVFKLLLDNTNFTATIKTSLIDRFMSSLFPYKDSVSPQGSKEFTKNLYNELMEINKSSDVPNKKFKQGKTIDI